MPWTLVQYDGPASGWEFKVDPSVDFEQLTDLERGNIQTVQECAHRLVASADAEQQISVRGQGDEFGTSLAVEFGAATHSEEPPAATEQPPAAQEAQPPADQVAPPPPPQ